MGDTLRCMMLGRGVARAIQVGTFTSDIPIAMAQVAPTSTLNPIITLNLNPYILYAKPSTLILGFKAITT